MNSDKFYSYASKIHATCVDGLFLESSHIWSKIIESLKERKQPVQRNLVNFEEDLFENVFSEQRADEHKIMEHRNLLSSYGFNLTEEPKLDSLVSVLYRSVPSIEYIYKDIIAIQEDIGNVSFHDGLFTVRTDDVTLEDVYLGPFDIQLSIARAWGVDCNRDNELSIFAHDPQYSGKDENNGYVHPHISSGQLCRGDGEAILNSAQKNYQLLDYFDIVNKILNTYGREAGPYADIENWNGTQCQDCDRYCNVDNITSSDCCDINICHECYLICSDCDIQICNRCAVANCEACGDIICDNCSVGCNNANTCYSYNMCKHCAASCSDCGEQNSCNNCSNSCQGCCDILCNNCVQTCSSCDDIGCADCMIILGSKSFCESCVTSCAVCFSNEVFSNISKCSDCEQEICSACFTVCDECCDTICDTCLNICTSCTGRKHTSCNLKCECTDE